MEKFGESTGYTYVIVLIDIGEGKFDVSSAIRQIHQNFLTLNFSHEQYKYTINQLNWQLFYLSNWL